MARTAPRREQPAPGSVSQPLFDVVRAFLDKRGFEGHYVEEDTVVRLDGNGHNGSWLLWLSTNEPSQRCVVYSTAKFMVEADRRAATCELMMRVNIALAIGNFELNVDTGQVSFRTGIDVEGDRLTEALFSQLVSANVEAFDTYLPAIEAVALRGVDPLAAYEAVEPLPF